MGVISAPPPAPVIPPGNPRWRSPSTIYGSISLCVNLDLDSSPTEISEQRGRPRSRNVGRDEPRQASRVAGRTRTSKMGAGSEEDIPRGLQAAGRCLLRLVARGRVQRLVPAPSRDLLVLSQPMACGDPRRGCNEDGTQAHRSGCSARMLSSRLAWQSSKVSWRGERGDRGPKKSFSAARDHVGASVMNAIATDAVSELREVIGVSRAAALFGLPRSSFYTPRSPLSTTDIAAVVHSPTLLVSTSGPASSTCCMRRPCRSQPLRGLCCPSRRGQVPGVDTELYRILEENGETAARSDQRRSTGPRPVPVLCAKGAKEIWSWDISPIATTMRRRFFYSTR